MRRVADTLSNSRGGSLRNLIGFGRILSLQKTILVAVLWPIPALLAGSGLREPQTCTAGRHLGSDEGGASLQLL